jgi:hypothetical protein
MFHRFSHSCDCLEFVFIALPLARTTMSLWLLFCGFAAAVRPRTEPSCDAARRLRLYVCLPVSYAILCISEGLVDFMQHVFPLIGICCFLSIRPTERIISI